MVPSGIKSFKLCGNFHTTTTMSSSRRANRPWAPPPISSIYGPPKPPSSSRVQSSPFSSIYGPPTPFKILQHQAFYGQSSAPAPSCEQCLSDQTVEGVPPAVNGASTIVFSAKDPDRKGGVLLTDILSLKDCLVDPGAPVAVGHPKGGGISVSFKVGPSTFSQKIVIPARCKHRPMTFFNLAYWLAYYLRANLKNDTDIREVYLTSLRTQNGHDWIATTRGVNLESLKSQFLPA
ncbi:hypothetical protein C8R46DRAFT_536352 [Mycena filopes]|nr:hypothetical protein C8R46DRAFT_536352 [Mycena filopes]